MTQPSDLITQLSTAWNDLRNAVVGRGVSKPSNVPQSLYDAVLNYHERWRKYLASMPLTQAILPAAAMAEWVGTYRQLAARATAAGLTFPQLAPSSTEQMIETMKYLRDAAHDGARELVTSEVAPRWHTYAMVAGLAIGLPLLLAIVYRPD